MQNKSISINAKKIKTRKTPYLLTTLDQHNLLEKLTFQNPKSKQILVAKVRELRSINHTTQAGRVGYWYVNFVFFILTFCD